MQQPRCPCGLVLEADIVESPLVGNDLLLSLYVALKRRRSERSAPVHQRDFTEEQVYCIRDYHAEMARRQRRSNAEEGGLFLACCLCEHGDIRPC